MSTAIKPDLWDAWERATAAIAHARTTAEPAKQNPSELLKEPAPAEKDGFAQVAQESSSNLRHSRRRQIRSKAEVVDWHSVQITPDVAAVVDASLDGILFQSERKYRMGMELLVRFPFPCASSPKQRATVVRIDEQPNGSSQVAVRFG